MMMTGTIGNLRRTAATTRLIQEISQRGKVEESYHSYINLWTYREPEGLRRDDSFKRIIKRRNLFEHGTLGFISEVFMAPMMRLYAWLYTWIVFFDLLTNKTLSLMLNSSKKASDLEPLFSTSESRLDGCLP